MVTSFFLWNQPPTIRFLPENMGLEELVRVYNISDTVGILFCGAISILIFFILLLLVKNRERIYLHYSMFLLFMLFYGIIHIRAPFLFDASALSLLMQKRIIEPTTIYSFAFYILFTLDLLDIRNQNGSIYRGLKRFAYATIVYASLYFLLFPYFRAIEHSIFLIARLLIFPLSLYFLLRIQRNIQSPLKGYFVMGSLAYFLGSLIATLRYTMPGLPLPDFYKLTSHVYFEAGIMIETLCFALALGHRIYLLHSDKEKAAEALIQQLYINEKMAKQLNLRLEEEIQEQLQQLRDTETQLLDQQKERLQAELEKDLAQSEMLARRLHINPHFIFNCLNAIKYLIQSGQNELASRYLIEFSKFIRMVLNASQESVISLYQEIEIIKSYLKLEQKRFEDEFKITLLGLDNPGLEEIMVPPLLLQPFVENAIWHGLLNSEQPHKEIKIEIVREDQQTSVIIDDNGIGRREALKLSLKKLYKSMGIELSKQRITLFNHKFKKNLKFIITDKENTVGESLGTRVELKFDVVEKSRLPLKTEL